MKSETLINRRINQGYTKPTKKEFKFLRESEGLWAVRLVHLGLYGEEIESRELINMEELKKEVRFLRNNFVIRYTKCFA